MSKRLQPISNELIASRMKFENPWWVSNRVDMEFRGFQKRLYFQLFYSLIEERDIKRSVVLMGPRRVGKTVMMYHAIDDLLSKKKIPSNRICFINIENPLYFNMGLEELFTLARNSSGNIEPSGWYVFFDEIQYLKDWEVHLKVLVDSYPKTKFIVSGSAAAALKLKSNESGAGRFTDFMLPPLTFAEYIYLKGYKSLIIAGQWDWKENKVDYENTNNINDLNRHFVDYINFGGYPEVIFSDKIRSNVSRYIKNDIVDKVLLRDLPSLYGIQNVQELNTFFTMLVYYSGQELSLDSLSTTSAVNKPTLKKYLEYLEAAFLIKQIHKIDEYGKRFQRQTAYKIYLTNPSLRSALFSPLQARDEAIGHMVETAIFSQWLHRDGNMPCYARWNGGEIDMVGMSEKKQKPLWAVEIKWSNKCYDHPEQELKSLISFCEKHSITDTIVTTIDKSGIKVIDGIKVHFTPCSLYAYNTGMNTIIRKFITLS